MQLNRLLFGYKSNLFLACRMCTNWRLLSVQNESVNCWSTLILFGEKTVWPVQLIDLVQKNKSYVNRTLLANFNFILPPTHTYCLFRMGTIALELYWNHAPKTCKNFAELGRRGYYNNTKFHRIIKDFMVQGGDPTATGEMAMETILIIEPSLQISHLTFQ